MDKLSKILIDETEILATFRIQLKRLINETGENLQRLDQLKQDIIKPAIDAIDRKFKKIVAMHRLVVGASVGTFSLTLVVSLINGDLLKILAGTATAATSAIVLSERDYQDKIDNLRDNPYYLFWRIQRSK